MNIKLKPNKNDIILIISLFIISLILIITLNLSKVKGKFANIYYNNKLILKIDLNINSTYKVKGYNGDVIIKVKDKKIKVDSENSPYHLCSKKGYISKTYESIICLPNKIVIEISGKNELDTVIK